VQRINKYYPFLIVGFIALLHLPFLTADPDTLVSVASRGAWTDEGLNTVQIRNLVNHGYLSMDECDNLIKTPFFGFVLVPFYAVLGTHIWVGRLLILSFILSVLFLFLKQRETRVFATVLSIVAMLQFHVFHFSHYSLAEMMAVTFILLGIFLLWFEGQRPHWFWTIASAVCFSMAYYTKVTYAYAIFIPLITCSLQFIFNVFGQQIATRTIGKNGSIHIVVTAFFAAVFYLKWYLPNRAVFWLVKKNQGTGRYDLDNIWNRIRFNWDHFLRVEGVDPFVLLLPVALVGLLFLPNLKSKKRTLLFALLSWFVLELHHVVLINPPTRYLVSIFFVGLAIISFALAEITPSRSGKKLVYVILILLAGYNISNYWESLQRRSYSMLEVRRYLKNYDLENETVLGVWATSLTASTNARSIPIWDDFTAEKQLLTTYRPRIIFSEHDEKESGQAYKSNGIDLHAEADSVKQFNIWRYKVNLFWMKQQ